LFHRCRVGCHVAATRTEEAEDPDRARHDPPPRCPRGHRGGARPGSRRTARRGAERAPQRTWPSAERFAHTHRVGLAEQQPRVTGLGGLERNGWAAPWPSGHADLCERCYLWPQKGGLAGRCGRAPARAANPAGLQIRGISIAASLVATDRGEGHQ